MTELRMLSLAAVIAALVAYYSIQVYRFAVDLLGRTQRSAHDDAGESLLPNFAELSDRISVQARLGLRSWRQTRAPFQ